MTIEEKVSETLRNYGYDSDSLISFMDLNSMVKSLLQVSDPPYILQRMKMKKPLHGNDKVNPFETLPFRCKKCDNSFLLSPIEILEHCHKYSKVCPFCIEKLLSEQRKQSEDFKRERLERIANQNIKMENINNEDEYGYFQSDGKGNVKFVKDRAVVFSNSDSKQKVYVDKEGGGVIELRKEVGYKNEKGEFVAGKKPIGTSKKKNTNSKSNKKFDSFGKKEIKDNGYIHKSTSGSSSIHPMEDLDSDLEEAGQREYNEYMNKRNFPNDLLEEKRRAYGNIGNKASNQSNNNYNKEENMKNVYNESAINSATSTINDGIDISNIDFEKEGVTDEEAGILNNLNKIITKKRNLEE